MLINFCISVYSINENVFITLEECILLVRMSQDGLVGFIVSQCVSDKRKWLCISLISYVLGFTLYL